MLLLRNLGVGTAQHQKLDQSEDVKVKLPLLCALLYQMMAFSGCCRGNKVESKCMVQNMINIKM